MNNLNTEKLKQNIRSPHGSVTLVHRMNYGCDPLERILWRKRKIIFRQNHPLFESQACGRNKLSMSFIADDLWCDRIRSVTVLHKHE